MYAVISPKKVQLPPGTVVRMPGTWQEYCLLQDSRGDASLPRLKYRKGEILLMSPLPVHGRNAHLIASIVIALLDARNQNYEAFTPITMELPEESGIEPDYCFYIENWRAVVGKERWQWGIEPPPDLVIEIDVTSYTAADDYLPYRVPEVWLFKNNILTIAVLESDKYHQQTTSRYFPEIDLSELVNQCWQAARERGMGIAIREMRQQLRS